MQTLSPWFRIPNSPDQLAPVMAAPAMLPDADTIRRTADEVIRRPEFLLDHELDSDGMLVSFYLRVLRAVLGAIQWLFSFLDGLPPVLWWLVVIGLTVVLIVLLTHMGYAVASLFRGGKRGGISITKLGKIQADPETLERLSAEAAARGDCSTAIRLLFKACLLRLEKAESKRLRGGTTNREVLRRHRNTPVYEPIKLFVEIIETKWYGPGVCTEADYQACLTAHAELLRSARRVIDVHPA